jgi:hypothetical protein
LGLLEMLSCVITFAPVAAPLGRKEYGFDLFLPGRKGG